MNLKIVGMEVPWDSSSRKLKRAAKHYKSLNDELRSYIREGRPFEYQAEIDREEAQFRIRVVGGEPPPDEMSLIVGDFVQNLRAALDHLIWAAVRANGNTPTMGNAFPIFLEDPKASRRKEALWARQLAGIADEAIPLIDQIQPYKRGEDARHDALACLKELSNEDKHRVVLQTLNAIPHPDEAAPDLDFECLDIEPIESYELHAMKPLENGDLIMEAKIKIIGPKPNIRIKGEIPDITATHPNGSIERLLVECKDWNKDVGKGTMDALVGVRDQANFDAAMAVTTKGFTGGAIDVAVDEDIAMVVLRQVRPDEHFVMSVEVQTVILGTDWSNVQVLVDPDADVSGGQPGGMLTEDRFLFSDGAPAETLREILESRSNDQEGAFDHEVRFENGRLAPMTTDRPIPIVGIKWTETISRSSPLKSVSKEEGKPCLVVEQLDGDGTPVRPRLVVDRYLNAWDIAKDGAVVERGKLL